MNNIDYNQTGGFPLSTQILEAAQTAYRIFNAHGAMAGDLAIITGCEEGGGGNVTNGFVHINGELLPFLGGQLSANVTIVQTSDSRGFEDGSVKPVIYTRYVTFGESANSYPWTSFRRPMTLFQLEDRILKIEKAVPIGLVAIWDRPADEIPEGWVEHTEMRGNVPVGHNPGDAVFGSRGNTVGTKEITLTKANLPNITIGTNLYTQGAAYQDDSTTDNIGLAIRGSEILTKALGSGQAHTNIQPSRIVQFIRFVGF